MCDVCFVLCLEANRDEDTKSLLDHCIEWFQPTPSDVVHVELAIPRVRHDNTIQIKHFATYLNATAGWQQGGAVGAEFYQSMRDRWRAVPVFATNASSCVEKMCKENENAGYSLARYVTSTRAFGFASRLFDDSNTANAHCGNLVARVLKRSVLPMASHHVNAYSPSRVYTDVRAEATSRVQKTRNLEGSLLQTEVSHRSVVALQQLLADSPHADTERALHESIRRVAVAYDGKDEAAKLAAERNLAAVVLGISKTS
jgi:hypothetical protein